MHDMNLSHVLGIIWQRFFLRQERSFGTSPGSHGHGSQCGQVDHKLMKHTYWSKNSKEMDSALFDSICHTRYHRRHNHHNHNCSYHNEHNDHIHQRYIRMFRLFRGLSLYRLLQRCRLHLRPGNCFWNWTVRLWFVSSRNQFLKTSPRHRPHQFVVQFQVMRRTNTGQAVVRAASLEWIPLTPQRLGAELVFWRPAQNCTIFLTNLNITRSTFVYPSLSLRRRLYKMLQVAPNLILVGDGLWLGLRERDENSMFVVWNRP